MSTEKPLVTSAVAPLNPPLMRGVRAVTKRIAGRLRPEDFQAMFDIAWDDYYRGVGGKRWFRWLDARKIDRIRRECAKLPAGSRVVDIGCGTGAILDALLDANVCRIGIEPNPALAAQARARGVRSIRANFDATLPFKSESLRLVLLVDTIEHVRSRDMLLSEVHRVLTDDGIFIVFTPPYDSITWQLGENLVCLLTGRPYVGHVSPFTVESMAALLQRHFTQFEIDRFNFGLTLFGVGRRKRVTRDHLGL